MVNLTVGDSLFQGFPPGFEASSEKYSVPPTAKFKIRKNCWSKGAILGFKAYFQGFSMVDSCHSPSSQNPPDGGSILPIWKKASQIDCNPNWRFFKISYLLMHHPHWIQWSLASNSLEIYGNLYCSHLAQVSLHGHWANHSKGSLLHSVKLIPSVKNHVL